MYIPKISTKRVLGLVTAIALATSGTIAFASSSQAVTTPTLSLTPATGAAAGGTIVGVKGKGFTDTTGTVQVVTAKFLTTACTIDASVTAGATVVVVATVNVTSATAATITTPALTAGSWYLCLWDSATSTSNILGQAKFVTAAGPTATVISGSAATIASASTLGGTTVSVTGTNFDKTAKASIDGLAAKTTYVSATKVSAVLPAHAAGTGFKIKVSTIYGSANTSTDTVSYVPVAVVTPTTGDGTVGNVVNLTGSGFNAYTFGVAATNQVILFVPAGTTVAGTALATLKVCTAVQVVSDTLLNCKAPALSGAYSVQIALVAAGAVNAGAVVTSISKSATYTAAAF
jgi:hypothetical protein